MRAVLDLDFAQDFDTGRAGKSRPKGNEALLDISVEFGFAAPRDGAFEKGQSFEHRDELSPGKTPPPGRKGVICGGRLAVGLLDAPDLPVFILVAVAGIKDILRAAIFIDVGGREQMHRSHVGARRLAGEGAVQFVDALPAVQVQRLGDSRDLVLLVTDALERTS